MSTRQSLPIPGKIEAEDGSKVYDFSLTKNVISMFISLILLWFIMTGIAKKYKKGGSNTAPTGIQNAIEPVVEFIRDNVAKPSLGKNYAKYMPLLLSLFFFIWINNLLGLLPGGANLTGNIAVTLVLALIFLTVLIFKSKKVAISLNIIMIERPTSLSKSFVYFLFVIILIGLQLAVTLIIL